VAAKDSRIGGLALRYATAIFELAAEERAIDDLAADLASLKTLLAASPELARLVRSPLFSREDQANGMEAVLKAAGAGALARKLVLLLAQKRRLFALSEIIRALVADVDFTGGGTINHANTIDVSGVIAPAPAAIPTMRHFHCSRERSRVSWSVWVVVKASKRRISSLTFSSRRIRRSWSGCCGESMG